MIRGVARSILLSVAAASLGGLVHGTEAFRQDVAQRVTFSEDVAPILRRRCASCHRPGGWGGFDALDYREVRPRARHIAEVVRRRVMPPWKPEPGHGGPFIGERRLSTEEITTLETWARTGASAGERASAGAAPPPPAAAWHLGPPDLVVALPEPYVLPGGERDVFRNFVLPVPISSTRFVRGLEFQPSDRSAAHHANIRIDKTGYSRRLDERDAAPGYSGIIPGSATFPDGHFLGWTPGQVAPLLPPDMSWRLDPGSSLVIQVHLAAIPEPSPLSFRVAFYFTDTPPDRIPVMLRMGKQDIDIPPGMRRYVIRDSYVLPVDVEVHAVQPHAHYLAREIRGEATLPDGSLRELIYIKEWDFHWQDVYRYVEPFWLPKGTTLRMQYSYDNSAQNPGARRSPPVRVRYGQQTSDEMGDLWIQVLARSARDRAALVSDFKVKERTEDVIGYRKMLESAPQSPSIQTGLANALLGIGRLEEATQHLQEAVQLDPMAASAHANLASVLMSGGRDDEAAAHFARAIALDPSSAFAHNGFGLLLLAQGDIDSAIEHLGEAARLEPLDPQVHNNLGIAWQKRGRLPAAIAHYQEATRLVPDSAVLHYNLANALRFDDQLNRAIASYRDTLRLDPEHERACFFLGTVLEARGRYAEAVELYRRALTVRPHTIETMTRLAWLLAAAPEPPQRNAAEAIRLAESAANSHPDAGTLDVLAASYAAAGDFPRAITTAARALDQATSTDQSKAMADGIRARLLLYRSGKPFELAPTAPRH